MPWLSITVNCIMEADRLDQRPAFPFILSEVDMNPFTESTVALPLSETPSNAANDKTLQENRPDSKAPAPERRPAPQGAREGRMPLRHPRAARLARRRARGLAAGGQAGAPGHQGSALQARWSSGLRKAVKAVTGLALAMALPAAWAVDVNSADAQQLETITGIGPKTAQVIIEERARGGSFESFDDLVERVKGIGPKKAQSLQAAGLTVGQASPAQSHAAPAAQRKAAK